MVYSNDNFGFPFQVFVISSLLETHREISERLEKTRKKFYVVERTPSSAWEVFSKLQIEDKLELSIMGYLFGELGKTIPRFPYDPDIIFYLKITPELSIERVELRGRGEEKHVPNVYLESLCKEYDDWAIERQFRPLTPKRLCILDGKKPTCMLEAEIYQILDEYCNHLPTSGLTGAF